MKYISSIPTISLSPFLFVALPALWLFVSALKISCYYSGMKSRLLILLILCNCSTLLFAQRDPVLKQIDLPHNYYFREMYLPQITTGPSSVSWAPDSQSVVYAMAGSLWI